MKGLVALTATTVLVFGSWASAQTNLIVTGPDIVNSSVSGDLLRWTVGLSNPGNRNISGFDLQLHSDEQSAHNVQVFSDPNGIPSLYEDSAALDNPDRRAVDTHLLFAQSELIAPGEDPTEPSVIGDSPNDGPFRIHGFVGPGVVFDSNGQTVVNELRARQYDVLQVVLRPGQEATLTGLVAVEGDPNLHVVGPYVFPEPSSIGLLSIAAFAMRRQRTSRSTNCC